MIKAAFFVKDDPFPPLGGPALRNWQNILACSVLGPTFVACTAPVQPRMVRLNETITVKYYGSEHAWLLPDAFVARFGKVFRRGYNWLSRPLGEKLLCRNVWHDLHAFDPTLVIFEEYKCAALAPALAGLAAARVYDAHNIEAILQRTLVHPNKSRGRIGRVGRSALKRERKLISITDQVWVCSEADKAHAITCFSSEIDIRVIPNTVDPSHYERAYQANYRAPQNDSPTLIFCGSFNYMPNQHAADFLIRDIFPKIAAALPEARLILVGRRPTAGMKRAAESNSRIKVAADVPDTVEELRRSQICLVPLRSGGGTRLKILEAFASGCAVISTRKGAEGLSVLSGKHLLFAETPDEFAASTVHLWRHVEARREMIRHARDLVVAKYTPEAVRCQLQGAIASIVAGSTNSRRQ